MKKPRYRVFTRSLVSRMNTSSINPIRFINIQTNKVAKMEYTTNPTSYQVNWGYELV